MSLTNKSDIKNHLSPSFLTETYLCAPAGQRLATGYSVAEPDAIETIPSSFAWDYSLEHTFTGMPSAPSANSTDSTEPQAPEIPKGAQS